jgi:hypothetical protein
VACSGGRALVWGGPAHYQWLPSASLLSQALKPLKASDPTLNQGTEAGALGDRLTDSKSFRRGFGAQE